MPETIEWKNESSALKARLQQLALGKNKSEIARKTGTSPTNIVRYLKGTRMPLEFAVALVKGLGVNPSWLLAGEGTALVSDITSGTMNMAGKLLELVEAMNSVAKMRLGALTGKHHLKVLRELNEALSAYDKLRARLNEHSVPIFRQLLKDLSRALERREMASAADLLKAAEQVARLCDDEALHTQLLSTQAQFHFFMDNGARALNCLREMFVRALAKGSMVSREQCQAVRQMVSTLLALGQHKEALAICEAALRLVPKAGRAWDETAMLVFLRGRLLAELGDLHKGLSLMMKQFTVRDERTIAAERVWITAHLLRAGLLRPDDAFDFGQQWPPKAIVVTDFACWHEDVSFLRRACKYALSKAFDRLGDMVRPNFYTPFLLRAFEGDGKAPADYAATKCEGDYKMFPEVFTAQLWRVLNRHDAALAAFRAAEQKIAATPEDRHIGILTRAIHHRNALWLAPRFKLGEQAARARKFFADHLARGFACFRHDAEAAQPIDN